MVNYCIRMVNYCILDVSNHPGDAAGNYRYSFEKNECFRRFQESKLCLFRDFYFSVKPLFNDRYDGHHQQVHHVGYAGHGDLMAIPWAGGYFYIFWIKPVKQLVHGIRWVGYLGLHSLPQSYQLFKTLAGLNFLWKTQPKKTLFNFTWRSHFWLSFGLCARLS